MPLRNNPRQRKHKYTKSAHMINPAFTIISRRRLAPVSFPEHLHERLVPLEAEHAFILHKICHPVGTGHIAAVKADAEIFFSLVREFHGVMRHGIFDETSGSSFFRASKEGFSKAETLSEATIPIWKPFRLIMRARL